MGLVGDDGGLEHYDGKLRFLDAGGHIVADGIDPPTYADTSARSRSPDLPEVQLLQAAGLSRRRVPRRSAGASEHHRRSARRAPTRSGPSSASWIAARCSARFYYHYARLIEILSGLEKIEQLLDDPDLLDRNVRAHAGVNNLEGIGVSEAPRGTLFHHYKVDRDGLITWVNLIIATGQNNAGHEPRRRRRSPAISCTATRSPKAC